MGCTVTREADRTTVTGGPLRGVDVDMNAISDTVMTLAVVALFADGVYADPQRRPHPPQGDRPHRRPGHRAAQARGRASTSSPTAWSSTPLPRTSSSPARIATYDDHRMAMSFALAGLKIPGVDDPRPGLRGQDLPGVLGRPGGGAIVSRD